MTVSKALEESRTARRISQIIRRAKEKVRAEREHDRIHQAATDAANQIEREKEQEQEELDAIERPASQAQVEAEQ